jgi:outer membrane protein assembly factor BamD
MSKASPNRIDSPASRRFRKPLFAAALGLVWLAGGCADTLDEVLGRHEDFKKKEQKNRTVEEIYNDAMDQVQIGWYETAAEQFDEVERQYPYSAWATKAQCYYEQISDVGRDQKMTQLALSTLQEVTRRFPKTPYARDARIKVDLTTDHLAGKEMNIGRYYQERGEHLAAINRFRTVIEKFQTTTHTPEALHRLTESYLALGITDEAQMAAAVLGHNYPGSSWYKDSFALLEGRKLKPQKKQGSWLSWMWDWAL